MTTPSDLATKDDLARLEVKIAEQFSRLRRVLVEGAAGFVASTTILTRLLA